MPAPGQPFGREVHDALYDLACEMYGEPGIAFSMRLGENGGPGLGAKIRYDDRSL